MNDDAFGKIIENVRKVEILNLSQLVKRELFSI